MTGSLFLFPGNFCPSFADQQAKNPAGLRRFTFPAPLSFFWKFLAPNDLPGGANSFYRGARGLSPGYWATGTLSPNGGATGPSEDPRATFRCFWACKFCKKKPLSPGHWPGDRVPVAQWPGDRVPVAQWPGDRGPFL